MSATHLFKRIVSIILFFSILISLLPVNAIFKSNPITSNLQVAEASIINAGVKDYALKEEMAVSESVDADLGKTVLAEGGKFASNTLVSLLSQLNTTGISIWSVAGDEDIVSPSGIDNRARVSYEIMSPIYADYESEHTAAVKFKLNSPNKQVVSFSYTIYSGSASYGEHYDSATPSAITFEIGETEKELTIHIPKLVNNPTTESEIASSDGEFWTLDRVLYINCNNIRNALFYNEKESMTVPVAIENQFDLKQSYDKAVDTYLVDLSNLSDVESFPETPGKYLNTGSEIKVATASAISGDVRTMIDTGVFSHLNMPIGYFSNENTTTGGIWFRIVNNRGFGFVSEELIVGSQSKIDFNLGDIEISQIGLGPNMESNGIIKTIDATFDYSGLSQPVYTYFHDPNGNYIQNQMNFTDKITPFAISATVPEDTFYFGENIPITVTYSEPVLLDDISIKANGTVLHPVERVGTVSNKVSFLYEVKEDYANSIAVTDIIGAVDLSGKAQKEASGYTLTGATLKPFDAENSFAYCANTTVNINQGENINAKGEVIISLKKNAKLSIWLTERTDGSKLLSDRKSVV